jgi:hypothetical protein
MKVPDGLMGSPGRRCGSSARRRGARRPLLLPRPLSAERLDGVDGAEVVNDVVLIQVLVRFGDDDRTRRVVEAVQQSSEAWMGRTT